MGNLGGTPKSAHLWGLGAACFSSALVPFVVPSMLPAPPLQMPPSSLASQTSSLPSHSWELGTRVRKGFWSVLKSQHYENPNSGQRKHMNSRATVNGLFTALGENVCTSRAETPVCFLSGVSPDIAGGDTLCVTRSVFPLDDLKKLPIPKP